MATAVIYGGFDIANLPAWTVFTAHGTSSQLSLWDQDKDQTFFGQLTYSGTATNPQVHGTVNRINLSMHSGGGYTVSDLNLDAARLQQLLLAPNGGLQYIAYVLAGNDRISGEGNLLGFAGDDTLSGGARSGTVDGGEGSDTFEAQLGSTVSANLGTGLATAVGAPASVVLQLRSIENLTGSEGNDTLAGNAGDNRLDGGAGVDTVSYASSATAVQVDLGAGTGRGVGNDTLVRVENVIGGSAADLLVGSAAANRFDGGAGNDTMRGGLGNDVYVLREAGDVIVEAAGGGRDTVASMFSYTLGAELENLQLGGSAALDGSGNALANLIVGNAGANRLRGGAGDDTLQGGNAADTLEGGAGADRLDGGTGDDQYVVGDALDLVVADAGGTDTVLAGVSYALGSVAIENLTLTGTALDGTGNVWANRIVGTAAANVLDGGVGADTLSGGAGGDTYVVDNAGDRVVELAGAGVDRVRASASHVLAINVEQLQLTGSAAIDGTGNGLANLITGNAAANVLNGAAGADTLTGGAGNDTYVVGEAGDVLVEAAGGGTDLVRSSVNWTLGARLEDLLLVGPSALQGTGNSLANHLDGNAGNNRLDGGAGADTLSGGLGNDSYVVDSTADRVVEAWQSGNDVVYSSISWVLGDHLEQLRLTGTMAINATGNDAANVIVGNAGSNRLDGGNGADTIYGGAGNDVYIVDSDDKVIESANAGTDTIFTYYGLALPSNVENGVLRPNWEGGVLVGNGLDNRLTGNTASDLLKGGAGADTLIGGEGSDVLDGGIGADSMIGGEGADTYVIDSIADVVVETGASLDDTVQAVVDVVVLQDSIENVELLGTSDLDATGNVRDNKITGNTGANRLDGGAGVDTLIGGSGDDTYVVDNLDDKVFENYGEGNDTVLLSASFFTVSDGLENVVLTGVGDINVWSYGFAVTVTSNAGSNRIEAASVQNQLVVSYARASGAVHVDLESGTATGDGVDELIKVFGVIGSTFDDTLRGSVDANRLAGGLGSDRFELWNVAADTVLDFVSGTDHIAIDQSGLAIGNGDLVIDGATDVLAAGSFGPQAELVTGFSFAGQATNKALAAAAIGSASAAYADGQSALFAVKADEGIALYRFVSAGADATVNAAELSLVGVLSGSTAVTAADFAWIA